MEESFSYVVNRVIESQLDNIADETAKRTIQMLETHKRKRDDIDEKEKKLLEKESDLREQQRLLNNEIDEFKKQKVQFEHREKMVNEIITFKDVFKERLETLQEKDQCHDITRNFESKVKALSHVNDDRLSLEYSDD